MQIYDLVQLDGWGRDYASLATIEEPRWLNPDEVCPACYEPVHRLRTAPLVLAWEAGSDVIGDLVYTGSSHTLIVTERVKQAFDRAGLSGYDMWPATIREPARRRPSRRLPMVAYPYTGPSLWDIHVREFVHIIPEQSTVALRKTCSECHRRVYDPVGEGDEIRFVVDRNTWKGWDFMRPHEVNGVLVTQRVIDVIQENQFTNFLHSGARRDQRLSMVRQIGQGTSDAKVRRSSRQPRGPCEACCRVPLAQPG